MIYEIHYRDPFTPMQVIQASKVAGWNNDFAFYMGSTNEPALVIPRDLVSRIALASTQDELPSSDPEVIKFHEKLEAYQHQLAAHDEAACTWWNKVPRIDKLFRFAPKDAGDPDHWWQAISPQMRVFVWNELQNVSLSS